MSSQAYLQVRIDQSTGTHLLEIVNPENGLNYSTATLTLGIWDESNSEYSSLVTIAEGVFANGNSVSLFAGGVLSAIGTAYADARTAATAGSEYYLVLMPFDVTDQSQILAEQEYTPTSLEYWTDANNSDTPMVSLVYDEYSFEPDTVYQGADLMMRVDGALHLVSENIFMNGPDVEAAIIETAIGSAFTRENIVGKSVDDVELVLVGNYEDTQHWVLYDEANDTNNDTHDGGGSTTELMIDDMGTATNTADDQLKIARAQDDTEDYTAADLILRISLDGGSNYGDFSIAMDVFATADGVGMVDTSISGGTYSISSQIEDIMSVEGYDQSNAQHSASLVLVDDFSAGAGNYTDLMQLPLNQFPGDPNASETVTHLRFDDPNNPTKLILDLSPNDQTTMPDTADLMVEYTLDDGTTYVLALIQDNAFSVGAGATINGNVFEIDAPDVSNILSSAGFDTANSDHHYEIVLVDDHTLADPVTVAGFLAPEGGNDDGGGGDSTTPPEFTELMFNDKGNQDPSDDTFMIVRGANDDEDYSGADLMAWIRPEGGADPYLIEIVNDPFSNGDEIAVGILNSYISTAFGGEANVPEFVELVLVDDSTLDNPFVLAELMGNNGDEDEGPTTDGLGEESPFELVEVAGERYGDIITFGIQLKDDADDSTDYTLDLASASFQIDWEDGEYEYWGGFENVAPTPNNDLDPETGSADLNTLGLTLNNAGEEATRINLETFIGSTPVTYGEGDLIATFMLERTDQSDAVENFIDLTKSNYTTADAPLDDILTAAQTFRYDYDQDTINIEMITASGEEVPDATLYVSSDTVTDGLSLVAVEQMGRLVKYQLVLNVSVPMTMDELAMIDTSQSVDIYGAHIFTDSLIDITSFEAGGDGAGAVSAAVITATDGDDASVTVGDAAGGYSGTEFFDQVDAAMSLLEDSNDTSLLEAIDVTDHLHIDVTALGDLQGDGLDGRYVLAEFVAFTDGSISFSDDWNVDDGITINQIAVNDADQGVQTFQVSDGSDVVLLGESVYLNPGLNIDAISATDALGALKIATDDTGYSQSQIIAADFDADGVVEAMDAYNILHYAVFGEGSEDEVPTWVYIDDIDSGTATAEAVTYDDNIDLFIGDLTDIDATGVLRGDVSENYTEIPNGYNTLDYYLGAFTEAMGDLTNGTDLEIAPTYV